MFLQIEDFLSAAEVQTITEVAQKTKFIDGRRSNPHNMTKHNVIAEPTDAAGQQAAQIALAALQRSDIARDFVFPRRVAIPVLTRYGVGMSYGAHIDSAFLPVGTEPLRSDVSCTVFISDPSTYVGGELVIYLGSEEVRIKGKAGQAVFYASTSVHQVAPVTSGERLVLVTFIESQIADPMHRDLLYALNEVRALEGLKMDWRNRTRLEYVSANLQRLWSR
ncbi:MAG TPA: Fe2+-dependent dioxygenase [Steroidobacteraceae bacterium]|nr:Fe2+-dependent dioxygenase [Steroidobacteraceae bacterium]